MELKVASILEKKTIATSKDEVEFEHAWKNGNWHCYQPLSFDLATVDSIQEKAAPHGWPLICFRKLSSLFHRWEAFGTRAPICLSARSGLHR